VLAFFPRDAQLPVGMATVVIFLVTLLRMNPYLRVADDRLHQLAQTELYMLLLAGYIVSKQPRATLSASDDLSVSVVLVGVTVGFMLLFVWTGFVFLRRITSRWWQRRQRQRRRAQEQGDALEEMTGEADGGKDTDEAAEQARTEPSASKKSNNKRALGWVEDTRGGDSGGVEMTPMPVSGTAAPKATTAPPAVVVASQATATAAKNGAPIKRSASSSSSGSSASGSSYSGSDSGSESGSYSSYSGSESSDYSTSDSAPPAPRAGVPARQMLAPLAPIAEAPSAPPTPSINVAESPGPSVVSTSAPRTLPPVNLGARGGAGGRAKLAPISLPGSPDAE
jgi:hypothetical protein